MTMNSYSVFGIFKKSTMLEFILVKLPTFFHTQTSNQNYHMAHREFFYLKGSYTSHPFLHGVERNPKAEK